MIDCNNERAGSIAVAHSIGLPTQAMVWQLLLAVAMAGLLLHPRAAQAWGAQGHQLVAEYAQDRLSSQARAEIDRLLALEPGASLVSVSTWADEKRSPATAAWHYLNFPRDADCSYDAAISCIDGNCVVGSIERQAAILASNAPDAERLKAMKYLVHMVADVHQPLHAGFADDRGGNKFQIQAYGRGTNLHALWDSALIDNWPGGMPALRMAMAAADAERDGDAVVAAQESCRIVSSVGFYPGGRKVGADYEQHWSATLVQRLSTAGARLAVVLESAVAAWQTPAPKN
jgi:nuclease S1